MSKHVEKRQENKEKAKKRQLVKRIVAGISSATLVTLSFILLKKPRN